MLKSELKEIIKECLQEANTGSIADQDTVAAENIKDELFRALEAIDSAERIIGETLSTFNAPGLRAAFLGGIKAAISGSKFNYNKAHSTLEKYYKR